MNPPQAPTAILDRSSPNHGPRRAPFEGGPRAIVLHYTDMISAEVALERLCDPAAQVSAHYLIARDGTVTRLVAEEQRAWHAGISCWKIDGQDVTDVNSASIGIELDNPGHTHGLLPYSDAQLATLIALCRDIMRRWNIPLENIVGHDQIAPGRKIDPGPLFPWDNFRIALS